MPSVKIATSAAIIAIVLLSVGPFPLAQGAIDAADVIAAIERGRDYLKKEQSPRGTWNEMAGYDGGVTCLVTLALLNSGVDVGDPVIQRALGYIRAQKFPKNYTVSLQTMVLATAEPERDRLLIERNVEWLEKTQVTAGEHSGGWGYPGTGSDQSNTQFAILALHEASRAGVRVNPEVWKRAAAYWRRCQNADGSWSYRGGPPSGSMTSAGVGALVITSLATQQADAAVRDGRVLCCQENQDDPALEAGLAWLGRHFSVTRNPGAGEVAGHWHYYYLYGLERVGRLSAQRRIGKSDWYREGAEYLVSQQDPLAHHWRSDAIGESNRHVTTAMALLFLSKGRWPVLMGKLQYGADDDWNNHRHDAANLTAYAEKAWDMNLTWQVVHPQNATVEDLLQTPVLYISGSKSPQLLPYAKKIRDFIDRGGFLFVEAACRDSDKFDEGFRELVTRIFPESEYRLQPMSPSHPIWRTEELTRPESPYVGKLWSIEYGCRTSVIYSAEDLSCYWELNRPEQVASFPKQVQQRIADANTIGINVLTYATNREPKGKEQSFVEQFADEENRVSGRGVIEIAKLRHGGGCDDAPGALANLLRTASQGEIKLRVATDDRMITAGGKELFRHHLVFMHGRHEFRFTPAERKNLRTYFDNGGMLLVDSICASEAFTKALRHELSLIFPDQPLEKISAKDPLLTTAYGGYDLHRVNVRAPQPQANNRPLEARVRQIEPQLEGIRLHDRWAVIFSPLDLSCALEKHEAVECSGYTREDAARLGINVLMYSLNQ